MENPVSYKSIRDMLDQEVRGLIPNNLTYEEFHWIVDKNILPPGFDQSPGTEPKKVLIDQKEVKVEERKKEKPLKKIEDPVSPPKDPIVPSKVEEVKSPKSVRAIPEQPVSDTKPKEKEPEKSPDEWVTVKTRSKKKVEAEPSQIPGIKSDPTPDQQASAKNKKKALKKRLKEVKDLIKKQSEGQKLNPHQQQKVQNKEALEKEILSLT